MFLTLFAGFSARLLVYRQSMVLLIYLNVIAICGDSTRMFRALRQHRIVLLVIMLIRYMLVRDGRFAPVLLVNAPGQRNAINGLVIGATLDWAGSRVFLHARRRKMGIF